MSNRVICDTGIISRYLVRKDKTIIDTIENIIGATNIVITPIIRIELHRWLSTYKGLGISNRNFLRKTIRNFPLLHISENISKIAIEITDKNDSLDASDILIGATAVYHDIELYTINKKHFKQIKGIRLI